MCAPATLVRRSGQLRKLTPEVVTKDCRSGLLRT
ncbi:hypothetical protein STVIR_2934 [Streptomyces viridochromogenes Tue57]|uniref:Uncharacterized protein n=1 Tax=Streptomyces viridochromogenes Tue57 TaxID=1160705 RepID=L8PF64_STRVR|nr:hypothetical protein STVIR_2934 [Streptomyces viridochromogenes Tue57]